MQIMNLFSKPKKTPSKTYTPVIPSGLIAHTEKGYFYVKGAKKFKFVSEKAMESWGLPVISTKDDKLNSLKLFGTLGFRDGTLIKDISDGKIYLVSDNKRRHIINPDVLEWINTEVIVVGQKEVMSHEEGEPLDG